MTRVDFYLLNDQAPNARTLLACRLAEKAYLLGHRVYIHTESPAQTTALDDLLWTFKAGSFVPHARHADMPDPPPPIVLGHEPEPSAAAEVLINLTHEVPAFFSRFERVAEVVDAVEQTRQAARERFRFYRERGYDLHSHELAGAS